jgi:hypothetical protein
MRRLIAIAVIFTCFGCSRWKTPDAKQPISHWLEVLKSPDRQERKKAIHMLRDYGVGDPATVPALIEALKDKHPDVRYEVIAALERIGPPAKEAAAALARFKNDPDAKLRERAFEALRSIARPDSAMD